MKEVTRQLLFAVSVVVGLCISPSPSAASGRITCLLEARVDRAVAFSRDVDATIVGLVDQSGYGGKCPGLGTAVPRLTFPTFFLSSGTVVTVKYTWSYGSFDDGIVMWNVVERPALGYAILVAVVLALLMAFFVLVREAYRRVRRLVGRDEATDKASGIPAGPRGTGYGVNTSLKPLSPVIERYGWDDDLPRERWGEPNWKEEEVGEANVTRWVATRHDVQVVSTFQQVSSVPVRFRWQVVARPTAGTRFTDDAYQFVYSSFRPGRPADEESRAADLFELVWFKQLS